MHMKTLVIDERTIIAGTANWTQQAFDLNFEDTLIINSEKLARQYLAKFDEIAASSIASEFYSSYPPARSRLTYPTPKPPTTRVPSGRVNAPNYRTFKLPTPTVNFLPSPDPFDALAAQIRAATNRVDAAIYRMNEERIVSAMIDSAKAGNSAIRVLADVGMTGGQLTILQRLAESGIDVRIFGTDRESLHMKTACIDGRYLWTGSANWTTGGSTLNIEDMLCFESTELAAYYTLWLDDIAKICQPFVPLQTQATVAVGAPPAIGKWPVGLPPSTPRTNWNDLMAHEDFPPLETNAWVSYLPDESYAPVLLDLIRNAQQTILIAKYKVADPGTRAAAGWQSRIVAELENAAARGVYVGILLHMPDSEKDALYIAHSDWADRLRAKGIDVRLSLPTLLMHAKFIAIDQCKAIVGSHNWSEGALDGTRVYESSALIIFPAQQKWLADFFFSRPVVSDMSSREAWERELTLVRHASRMRNKTLNDFLESYGVDTESGP